MSSSGPSPIIVLIAVMVGCSRQGEPPARAPSPPQAPVAQTRTYPAAVSHGLRTTKKIALTFDACSTRGPSRYDEEITKILVETKTPATLFLGGRWIEERKEQARQLASIPGFELGNHAYTHPHLKQLSDELVRTELKKTQDLLRGITGRQPTLFRPPYGEYDDRIVRIAGELGLLTIEYDLPSGDPDKSATSEKLAGYVGSMARRGSIVVMHINGRGWHTAEALPEIIANLRKRGFKLVTIGELLGDMRHIY
jgi:peptidoglycan-N-acetylglucosamine deacetylase